MQGCPAVLAFSPIISVHVVVQINTPLLALTVQEAPNSKKMVDFLQDFLTS